MCRKYHFHESVYIEVTEERLNIINLAYQKCGSYCGFGRELGIGRWAVKKILNGDTIDINGLESRVINEAIEKHKQWFSFQNHTKIQFSHIVSIQMQKTDQSAGKAE